jgi:predicted anti-sigma-YlaC factor YlaD
MARHTHTPEECRRLLGQLNEYLDGELAEELCAVLETHLDGCADCRVVLDSLTRRIALYRGLREQPVELPPDVEGRLMRRLAGAPTTASDGAQPESGCPPAA